MYQINITYYLTSPPTNLHIKPALPKIAHQKTSRSVARLKLDPSATDSLHVEVAWTQEDGVRGLLTFLDLEVKDQVVEEDLQLQDCES